MIYFVLLIGYCNGFHNPNGKSLAESCAKWSVYSSLFFFGINLYLMISVFDQFKNIDTTRLQFYVDNSCSDTIVNFAYVYINDNIQKLENYAITAFVFFDNFGLHAYIFYFGTSWLH